MTLQPWHYENECPNCGRSWGEHRAGYSASKCKMEVPDPHIKLQEAIEEVKLNKCGWEARDAWTSFGRRAQAIATILNAVVKGELK